MTVGYLMDVLKMASEFICRIAEGDTNLTDEEIRKIADVMSVMRSFIIYTPVGDE